MSSYRQLPGPGRRHFFFDTAAPLQYKWWVFDGVTWNVAREWAAGNTFAWVPAVGNSKYQVGVWVRSSGGSGPEALVAAPFAIQ